MAEEEVALRSGTRFGRYQIVRKIGRGGMAAVYEAIHVELDKRVAIKALTPPQSDHPELVERFLREGQAASRIRHPHVVDIYDVGTHKEITYLVMEFLEGEELGKKLAREGKLVVEEAVALILPVIAAIAAAHEEGVIHRDLKPANIFLARDRYGEIVPKVLDFGISKRIDDSLKSALTNTGALMGTPLYMSPEQATGEKNIDGRADQYSLGVILYQCLTGRRAFEADTMYAVLRSIVEGTFALPRMANPAITPALESIVLRAMKTRAADRFPRVHDLGVALYAFGDATTRARWGRQFDLSSFEGPQKPTELMKTPFAAVPREALAVGETDEAEAAADFDADSESTSKAEAALAEPTGELLAVTQSRPEAVLRTHPGHLAAPPRFSGVQLAMLLLVVTGIALGVTLYVRMHDSVVILPEKPVPVPVIEVKQEAPAPVKPEPSPRVEPPPRPAVEPEPEPAPVRARVPAKRRGPAKTITRGTNGAPIID